MRLTSALRSAVAVSLLLATPVLAAGPTPAPAPAPGAEQGHRHHGKWGHKKGFKFERKLQHLQQRLDRAVAEGRITQAQADQFKAEGQQLHDEIKAKREAAGGQLSDNEREQLRERMRDFRAKVKGALKPKDAQPRQQ